MANETGWERNKEPLGIWEHRGKVAFVGRGHSPMDRRWDGVSMDKTLGAYTIIAAQRAMEDAGISPDQVDGIVTCPGAQSGTLGGAIMGSPWAPRPYFAPPYDSEDGLSVVTGEWLAKQMGLKKVKYINSRGDHLWRSMGLAVQAVGDGRCSVCLVPAPTGNMEGRYQQNPSPYAGGGAQWPNPWGWGNTSMFGFYFNQYCRKYGTNHDRLAPFVVNMRRNGLMVPWGYYALHEPQPFTTEDYLNGRWIAKPLGIFDCDRPVQAAACYVVTTAERAKDMKQKPVYVLDHTETTFQARSQVHTLEEIEAGTDTLARKVYAGSGLRPSDIDIFQPYDGFATFTQHILEAFKWRGVKRGEALDFYAGDISLEGPNPLNSGGGNIGTGRLRTVYFTDPMEQLQGRAGPRQVKIKAEVAVTIGVIPSSFGTLVLCTSPD